MKLVERFSLLSGAAGLIPVPLVDLAAIGGLQIQMLHLISKIYGVPFAKNRGKAVIASLAGSMIPASSGIGAASIVKSVPIVGTAISAIAMPVLSAGATYAIGMAFIQHFATGGTLLDFNVRDYREFIKAQKEMWGSDQRRRASDRVAIRFALAMQSKLCGLVCHRPLSRRSNCLPHCSIWQATDVKIHIIFGRYPGNPDQESDNIDCKRFALRKLGREAGG